MVRFDSPKFKNMSRSDKVKLINKQMKEADKRIEDVDFYVDLMNKYKQKLQDELSRN